MTPERWQEIERLCQTALELEAGDRAAFLKQACAGDEELRREVESLLGYEQEAATFIGVPAADIAARAFAAEDDGLPEGHRLGPYVILSLLGKGGMGEVYLARDERLGRKVAVKLLPPAYLTDPDRVRRFVLEARATSALSHPNILTIYEIGEADGHRLIVTEYVEGETLRQLMDRGPLPVGAAVEVAAQVAGALEAAHAAGIVHRDIKPENVMLRPDGLVKVLDFGLAKLTAAGPTEADAPAQASPLSTASGVVLGTVAYMSPEQARGQRLDARTDVFSLGVLLYEMLAGERPFKGDSAGDVVAALLTAEPPPLSRCVADAPAMLERVVATALRKEPGERYQTAGELLADLQRLKQDLDAAPQPARLRAPAGRATAAATAARQTATAATGGLARARQPFSLVSRRGLAVTVLLVAAVTAAFAYLLFLRGAPPARPIEIKSLAVLPLKSLSRDASDDYLGLGIADTIITKISQLGEVTVRPTSAVRKYADQQMETLEAARQLRVDSVLDGTLQRAGERLRVNVNLLRAQDGASLWSESFDVNLTDIFAMQDRVAQQVAARLRLKLSPAQQARLAKRYTSNSEAYEYYSKGAHSFDKARGFGFTDSGATRPREMETAIAMFQKAIETDPQYALAHAQLAYCFTWMALFVEEENPAWIERARQALRQAETLDPNLAEVHVVRHEMFWSAYEGFKIEAAMRELLLAQQLNPSVGHTELGVFYAHMGLEEASVRELRRAMEINPTSEIPPVRLIESHELLYKPDEAIATQQRFFDRPGPVLPYL